MVDVNDKIRVKEKLVLNNMKRDIIIELNISVNPDHFLDEIPIECLH